MLENVTFISLNDVYEALGFPKDSGGDGINDIRPPVGHLAGWVVKTSDLNRIKNSQKK